MGFTNSYREDELTWRKTKLISAEVGDDNTTFSPTDTGVISVISGTENNIIKTDLNKGVKVSYVLLEGQGNGSVVREIAWLDNDDDCMIREVLPDTTKTSDLQITIESSTFTDINQE